MTNKTVITEIKCLEKIANNFLQGDWHEAMRFCSKLGMSALTVYNVEKQGCLYDKLGTEIFFRTMQKYMECVENRSDGGR